MNSRIIETFHKKAKEQKLHYLIVGGFAASYWGEPRFTADIDYVIEETKHEVSKKIIEELDYKLVFIHPEGSFAHYAPQGSDNFRIDFMLVNKDTWKKLYDDSSTANFGGEEPYPIVSANHLIAMKLHSCKQPDRREYLKDLNDIAEIMLHQKISFDELLLNGIIKKHGNKERIKELKKILESKSKKI